MSGGKNVHFVAEMFGLFCIEMFRFCPKNVGFCIENVGFCIENVWILQEGLSNAREVLQCVYI